MFKIQKTYILLTAILLLTEIIIAFFVHNRIIRPHIGDLLVVILIYCFFKSFLNIPVVTLAICVLLFAYTVEILQYLKIVELLGLQNSKLARIIIGTSFDWIDMIAYTLGITIVIGLEKTNLSKILDKKQD